MKNIHQNDVDENNKKMILPQIESDGEQLNISENLYRNHFVKIMTDEHH